MKKSKYTYLKDGFEGILYDTESEDDRLLIVIQGLKGLELPEKYAGLFAEKGYSVLAMTYYGAPGLPDTMRAIPLEMFQTAEVITCGFTRTVHSTFGIPVIVDKTIDEVNVGDYDALAIPGGFEEYGFYEEAFDQRFLDMIAEFDKFGKYIASICVGALPIGKSGVLTGRKATTYHLSGGHRQRQLAEFGVDVIPDLRIVVDKNIITSFCPETAAGWLISCWRSLPVRKRRKRLRLLWGMTLMMCVVSENLIFNKIMFMKVSNIGRNVI